MDVAAYLETKRQLIDEALEKVFDNWREPPKLLLDSMRYAVFSGGKRIRPILTLATFEAINGSKNRLWILPFACGIELIHTFSLINDDLPCMDNDDWRRGKPTLHKVFDETTAILAATALLIKAYELFSASEAPATTRLRAIQTISEVIGASGIVAGQLMDIKTNSQSQRLNPKLVSKIALKKTAEFIAASIKIGAMIAQASEREISELWRAGIELGMLFQITDDILDAKTDKKNQPTLVKLYGLTGAQARAKSYARNAKQKFIQVGKRFMPLVLITDWVAKRK